MTKAEFIEEIDDFYRLRDFCNDNGYMEDSVYDLLDSDEMDDAVADDIREFDGAWYDLRDYLGDISSMYDWYMRDGTFDYRPLDDSDFQEMKDELLEILEGNDFFEPDEPEDSDDAETDAAQDNDHEQMSFPSWSPDESPQEPEQEPEQEPKMVAIDFNGFDSLCELSVMAVMENRGDKSIEPQQRLELDEFLPF